MCLHGVPASCVPVPQGAARAGRRAACAASPSTSPGSASPSARRPSTTPGRASGASATRRSTRSGWSASTSSCTTSAARSGFELAAAMPDRVASLTVLNTIVEVGHVQAPVVDGAVRPARHRRALPAHADQAGVPDADAPAGRRRHVRGDAATSSTPTSTCCAGRRRRGVPADHARLRAHASASAPSTPRSSGDVPYPVQIVWGEHDPALKLAVHGEQARRAAGLDDDPRLPGQALPPGGPGARDRRRASPPSRQGDARCAAAEPSAGA